LNKNLICEKMKLLHTGDWHIGHILYGYDRACDHEQMLDEISKIARDQKPDVIIVCGDIFHTGQPSAASMQLLNEGFEKIKDASPSSVIIATAGNHDSPSRHEVLSIPWSKWNVIMIGQPGCSASEKITNDILDRLIIEIPQKGFVVAMPYVHPRNLPENFYQRLLDRVAEKNNLNLPVVMMAHLTVSGADFSGHENSNEHIVGGVDAVALSELGSGYDYLALGHIHHPQFVPTSGNRARYAGTPMPVNFDEAYPHSVSIVSIDSHNDMPQVVEIPVNAGRKLVTLGGSRGFSWDEIRSNLDLLLQLPDLEKGSLIRVNMHLDPGQVMPPEAETTVRNAVVAAQHNYCLINVVRDNIQTAISDRDLAVDELRNLPPITIAKQYAADTGVAFSDDMIELFNEIEKIVTSEAAQ
jgi:exonuclease SbcD